MTVLIAHRGNVAGPNPSQENRPDYVAEVLNAGYHAEVDVWFLGRFMLGHDEPQYPVDLQWLRNNPLWLHCKNMPALMVLRRSGANCFWHAGDRFTLTSNGTIWGFEPAGPGSIVVDAQLTTLPINCLGVCSDYVQIIKESLNESDNADGG